MAGNVAHKTECAETSTDYEKRYKMVIIGETGSGKTSFVELLLNYAKQFQTESQLDFKKLEKLTKRNIRQRGSAYESDTIESVRYQTNFGDFLLDIIDTPGFGDTRGEDQRRANIEDILNAVKKEHYLNCICVVINGTSSRLTNVTKDVMTGMVSILPETALQNMIIVFTNTQDEFSLTFDINILRKYDLYVPKEHTFLFDNPFARHSKSDSHPHRLLKKLKFEFEITFETLKEMFKVIQNMPPSPTIKFGNFQNSVKEIEATITRLELHHENKERVKNQIQEIVEYLKKHEIVVDKMQKTYKKTDIVFTSSKNVVCNHSQCYRNCHENCHCWFTFFSVRACKNIKEGVCQLCGHSSDEHSKNKFLFQTVDTELPLPHDLQQLVANVKDKKQALQEIPAVSGYDAAINEITTVLEQQLKFFQSIGASAIFSANATSHVANLKKRIEKIPYYEHKKRIVAKLDIIIRVFSNPFSAEDNEVKYHWACGILEANPEHLSEKEISRLFREQSRKYHPDNSGSEELSYIFKKMNHAKDYLIGKVRKMRPY